MSIEDHMEDWSTEKKILMFRGYLTEGSPSHHKLAYKILDTLDSLELLDFYAILKDCKYQEGADEVVSYYTQKRFLSINYKGWWPSLLEDKLKYLTSKVKNSIFEIHYEHVKLKRIRINPN